MTEEEDYINTELAMITNLNIITSFLNSFGKEYEVKMWGSGTGWDVIVTELDTDTEVKLGNERYYKQTISINDNGFLKFEKQEKDENP